MGDDLATYLHDHLAGAAAAINLLEALEDDHAREPLGAFVAELRAHVEADREVLRALAERVGNRSNPVKEATAWIAEKVGRLKLGRTVAGEFGTFEALEGLSLGILGKRAVWRALARVADDDDRLRDVDYELLIERAVAQYRAVEEWRLGLADAALRGGPLPDRPEHLAPGPD